MLEVSKRFSFSPHGFRRFLGVLALTIGLALMSGVMAYADPVIFTQDTTIPKDDPTYENLDLIVDGCTLTVAGPHTFNSLKIQNYGSMTSLYNVSVQLSILKDLTVDDGSSINFSARSSGGPSSGYDTSGQYYGAGGGGYGGNGGTGSHAGGGSTYGSPLLRLPTWEAEEATPIAV